jgi:hypothetical protein
MASRNQIFADLCLREEPRFAYSTSNSTDTVPKRQDKGPSPTIIHGQRKLVIMLVVNGFFMLVVVFVP